jgi:dienelactone hydrolase
VLFISPGDGPQGFKSWQGVCEKEGVIFASPYGAGNPVPTLLRTRIILDVFDDVRRHHKIDPERTYLTGFSGGGRMACAIGFALPECFGGILPICGTNTINRLAYLRHRTVDRISVAFITGENDTNRKENEQMMHPWLEEIGVRSKLWVVPKMGHAVPPPAVIAEAYAWVAEDVKRRRDDVAAHPKLALGPDEGPSAAEQATRLVDAGLAEIKEPTHVFRGVMMLQGATQRWPKTEAAGKVKALLGKMLRDESMIERISKQGAEDEVRSVTAQAKATERMGNIAKSIEAWQLLVQNYEGTPIAAEALENIRRLKAKGSK